MFSFRVLIESAYEFMLMLFETSCLSFITLHVLLISAPDVCTTELNKLITIYLSLIEFHSLARSVYPFP
jgi:hypothetical protein